MTDSPMLKYRCPRCSSAGSEVEVALFRGTPAPAVAREDFRADVIRALTPHIRAEHPEIDDIGSYIRVNNGWRG